MKSFAKRLILTLGLLGTFVLTGCNVNVDPSDSTGTSINSGSATSGSAGSLPYDIGDLVDSRYPGLDFTTYGTAFRNKLSSLITGKTTTYSNCLSVGAKAAAYPTASSSTFIPFYHEAKDSEKVSSGCNREHVWPNSRGGNMIEIDPIVIRPTVSADNSARGNNFYGNTASNEFDPASKTSNGSSYAGARGEAARIILYAACRYYSELSLSNNPNDNWNSVKSMGTLKTLLQWNNQYQPTEFEKTVNDRYASMGYARNPFVDHPEYANFIWDANGLRVSQYVITTSSSSSVTTSSYVPSSNSSSSVSSNSSASSSSSSSSSSAGDSSFKKTFTISDWPSTYGTNNKFTSGGVSFVGTNVGTSYTTGYIQIKKNQGGYFYNTSALSGYDYIALKIKSGSVVPIVTYGDASNPSEEAEPTQNGSYYYYNISQKPFFKITSGSSVGYINEFHMA